VLGILNSPPTNKCAISSDKSFCGCVPVVACAAPMESCPIVFSFCCADEFYSNVFLLWGIDVVPCVN